MEASRYIFFPDQYRKQIPRIIYVTTEIRYNGKVIDLVGCETMEELEDGRSSHYPVRRCQPYTDALWDACQEWVRDAENLKKRYEKLMKGKS